MGRVWIELPNCLQGTLKQVLDWAILYCARYREEPVCFWLSMENYRDFRLLDFDSATHQGGVFYRGIPIQSNSIGMTCAIEIDLRGKLPWPPNYQEDYFPPIKTSGTVYDAIVDESLV